MPMLSSQPQQYHAQQQASTFPALANSPLQGSSSSFTLLNSSEPMDITPPPLQPHSTTQPDLFAQTIAFPADINIATRPGGARVLRRRSHAGPSNGAFRRASSPGSSSRSHPYMPQIQQPSSAAAPLSSPFGILPSDPLALRRSNSIATLTPYVSTQQAVTRRPQKTTSSTFIIPAINQDGTCKRCANCYTAETPSWRRHPDTQELLCNACGLYLRLHRKARPITIDESGNIQVVRKNAAIQREPINLRVAPFGQTQVLDPPNGRGYQQYSAPNGTMGLQLTSPVHSMDGVHDISSPFSAMHVDHYSLTQTPTYSVSNNAAGQQASVARFSVDDILQPRALRSEAGGSHQNTNENTSTGGDNDLISNADSSMKHSPSNEP
ncbi:GATA zinc finger protein 3 [Coemansia sp. RSA 1646]|nr:GATA zinc finger protein 3 [Coemansia sp. RSA 1646]KAJ1771840.1 hypothetical protein LPJ74_002014 [Coemansia sp. RSA 1843]KAJ2216051.1 hypothetical protein EV179_001702 [Coemansia sp. RSA 487]